MMVMVLSSLPQPGEWPPRSSYSATRPLFCAWRMRQPGNVSRHRLECAMDLGAARAAPFHDDVSSMHERMVFVAEMTGGQAIARTLHSYGVDTIFGLPGVQLDNLFDALYEMRDEIRVLNTRHEQATAYMALGYAQSTGKVGVCLVVPGPGLLNATAALSTAYATNTPVLALSGQIESSAIDKGYGALHEIPNQLRMIASVTKWA